LKLIFARIIIQNTSINFIILENAETSFEFKFNNCKQISLNTNSYFFKTRYLKNLKISKVINHTKSDLIINFGSSGVSSKLKQILIIENHFFSSLKSNQIQNITSILYFFDKIKYKLIEEYEIDKTLFEKISITPIYAKNNINSVVQQNIKDGYAYGREYFLYDANYTILNDILHFLKAFSIFKKWQNSNMKLLILFTNNEQKIELLTKLENYKYKDDVVVVDDLDEERNEQIIASSYCYINNLDKSVYPAILLQAIQHYIPVICSVNNPIKENLVDNALYTSNDINDIADKMKIIYKDENLKNRITKLANQNTEHLNINTSVTQLQQIILEKLPK
jgi:glycosyltransferase involved in cell wall biosynthesis